MVEHMDVEAALRAQQCGEQTDRPGAGDQKRLRLPCPRAPADAFGMIPGLGDDAGRLDQHAGIAERTIDLDEEVGLDAEKIRTISVAFLDAALGVAAVAAHIPFADRAGGARHRIGPAHDADDAIAGAKSAVGRRLAHFTQRLVADHQPLLAGRRPAVGPRYDFTVGAADAQRQAAHQHGAVGARRLGDVFNAR